VRSLAERVGAELVLLHVTQIPESFRAAADVTLDGVVERERREAQSYLRRVARELGATGLTVRSEVAVGEPAAEIVRGAEHEQVDLLALATHGRSGLQRWLHGSVADAVLHTTTKPLLLLRPTVEAPVSPDIKRVIVPLDGSPVAEEALPAARELAGRLGVPMELLRVVEIISLAFAADPYGGFYVDYARVLKALEDGARAYLEELAGRERQHGVTVETFVEAGVVAEAITHHAAGRPGSLLVIGSHGRSGWRAAVMGSVARRVVLLATGPVMVLRPAAARSA
jgi:nucleotide-binding universal stress UspA family protein